MNCNTKELSKALDFCCRVTGKRTTLPILNSVMVEAKDGWLTLTASDMECDVSRRVPCEGDLAAACVPARRFKDMVALCGEKTALEMGKTLAIASDAKKWSLPILEATAFPSVEINGNAIGVPLNDLAEALEFCVAFVGDDATRPALECVFVRGTSKLLSVMSSDGRIASKIDRPLLCAEFKSVLHGNVIHMLASALREPEAVMILSDKKVTAKSQSGHVACRLMDLEFPERSTNEYFSFPSHEIGVFSAEALKDAIVACESACSDKSDRLKLTFNRDGLLIEHNDSDSKSSAMVPGVFGDGQISAAAHYLKTAVSQFKHPSIKLGLNQEHQVLSLKASDYECLLSGMRSD